MSGETKRVGDWGEALTAELYLLEHPTDLQPRFDVAEVYAPQGTETAHPEINYIENAF